MAADMRIGEVARRAGVRVSHIRYYEDIGLLPTPERVSGQRRYGPDVLRRLAVIDVAQRASLSLDEIRGLLEHGREPMSEHLRDVAGRRRSELDALIARAEEAKRWLDDAAGCECESVEVCVLFDEPDLPASPA